MSNPTTKVAQFNGALDGFTVTGPERYAGGLWLEEATTNRIPNPIASTTTSWSPGTNIVLTGGAALPAPIPDSMQARGITTCLECAATGSVTLNIVLSTIAVAAVAHTNRFLVYVPSSMSATAMSLIASNFTSATGIVAGVVNMALRDQWQEVIGKFTPDAGDLSGQVGLRVTGGTMLSGEKVYVVCPQSEPKGYATSFVPMRDGGGTLLGGYAFSGTANNSESTRAASSASVATAGHIDPSSGSLAFRVTPTIETGVEEIWGEAGTKGVGTDHLRWGRDSTKHPFVEWSSNDAAYQRLTATETIDAGTERFLYLGWSGVQTWLQADDTAINVGTRAAPTGSLGAGNLILEAL